MTTLRGKVFDQASGRQVEARVSVRAADGRFVYPSEAILKVGQGEPFFYSDGTFEVDLKRGQADIIVERGTEYRPYHLTIDIPLQAPVNVEIPIKRWIRMPEQGWYAGNTHVHYDQNETRATDRLRLDPRVEDLPVLIVSWLKRRELAYASNAFPIGRNALSTPDHVIDVGIESRHNHLPWEIGLGHIMLVNLLEAVGPISRGILVDDSNPDYPPLIDACDLAHRQGGLVLWCHNAVGMEAPVAAALGKLDGLNLFDPAWADAEYDIWYRLLNCGIRLPASTGSDWFICSSNRVYVEVGNDFRYDTWLAGLREGRTFVTDGPILDLRVEGNGPSIQPIDAGVKPVDVVVNWHSVQPIDRIEIVCDGEVAAVGTNMDEGESGRFAVRLDVNGSGWIAARCWGRRRNSYGHALWAHTSPVYLSARPNPGRRIEAATFFVEQLDRARNWLGTEAHYEHSQQRDRMLALFRDARTVYERWRHD